MRAARPDGRVVAVQDFTLTRDVYRIHFQSGTFHLLAPLGDRTWGAVFLGKGSFELRPSAEAERRHLALVSNQKNLEVFADDFDRIVLLFSDHTADEIAGAGPMTTGTPDATATTFYADNAEVAKMRPSALLQFDDQHTPLSVRATCECVTAPAHCTPFLNSTSRVEPSATRPCLRDASPSKAVSGCGRVRPHSRRSVYCQT
ncbi:MAG TPA: hypothetical protein VMS98_03740 [Thermoanaerobaculia bacterium]|nr:hypothetical protein [Thermoanaerobaculia bacterium]